MSNQEDDDFVLNQILDQIKIDLGQDLKTAMDLEIGELQRLTLLTDSIEQKLNQLYGEKYPKQCNNCLRIYHSRQQYLQETEKLKGPQDTVFDKSKVQEYRNCVCGSTLLILTEDRRDLSAFGDARRQLFDLCVAKLEQITKKDKDEVIKIVRQTFRQLIQKVQTNQLRQPPKN